MEHYNKSVCGAANNLDELQNEFCPNYFKDVSYKSKMWNCPLCESTKKSTSEFVKTPVIVSMSEEVLKK